MNISTIRRELGQLGHRLDALPLTGERYASCLSSYEQASSQRQQILAWVRRELVPRLSTDSASVLSIGCGAGDLDKELLAAIAGHSARVSYCGVEPDTAQCERFAAAMGAEANERIRIEAHNVGFESFPVRQSYDLVLMVHSLYYMPDPAGAIDKALSLVKDQSQLVVLLAANDTLNELSSSFWQIEADRVAWFSEDLSAYLDMQGWPFTSEKIEARLDMTPCFDANSVTGSEIADFLAHVSTRELPDHLQDMIREYLDATSYRSESGRWLPHNVDAFSIPAQAMTRVAGLAGSG